MHTYNWDKVCKIFMKIVYISIYQKLNIYIVKMRRILEESCENIPWENMEKVTFLCAFMHTYYTNGEPPLVLWHRPKVAFLWKSRVLHSVSWSQWYPEFEITCKSSRRRMHAYIKDVPVRMREHIFSLYLSSPLCIHIYIYIRRQRRHVKVAFLAYEYFNSNEKFCQRLKPVRFADSLNLYHTEAVDGLPHEIDRMCMFWNFQIPKTYISSLYLFFLLTSTFFFLLSLLLFIIIMNMYFVSEYIISWFIYIFINTEKYFCLRSKKKIMFEMGYIL